MAPVHGLTFHNLRGDLYGGLTAAVDEGGGRVVLYHLSGPFSFGAAKGMARRLAAADEYDALVLDLSDGPCPRQPADMR